MVAPFSLHHDRDTAVERGIHGFRFFNYAMGALVQKDNTPGRTTLWADYMAQATAKKLSRPAPGIGTPEEFASMVGDYQDAGVDQVIFLQQGGLNEHEHICESLQLFGDEVYPRFAEGSAKARGGEGRAPGSAHRSRARQEELDARTGR